MGRGLYIQSVEEAADMAGGYEGLAERLGVERDEVLSWVAGLSAPPTAAFLRIVDMLLEELRAPRTMISRAR
jgi:hypothetical protein